MIISLHTARMCSNKGGAHGQQIGAGSKASRTTPSAWGEGRKHMRFAWLFGSVVLQMAEALQSRGSGVVCRPLASTYGEPEPDARRGGGDNQVCTTELVQRRFVSRPTGDLLGTGRSGRKAAALGADDCSSSCPRRADSPPNRLLRTQGHEIPSMASPMPWRCSPERLRRPLLYPADVLRFTGRPCITHSPGTSIDFHAASGTVLVSKPSEYSGLNDQIPFRLSQSIASPLLLTGKGV